MTDTKTIEVTGCQDCPFGYNDPFIVFCQHPGVDCKSMDLDDDANVITPSWCPLKVESITIKLKDN